MKPGDVVEFKDGLWGIAAPENLGILLDRWRMKGVPMVRVHTTQGAKEAKAENLTKRAFKTRYEGRLEDAAGLSSRLRQLLGDHVKGNLAEEAEDDLSALEHALWDATCQAGRDDWTAEEIAVAHYGSSTRQQVRDVNAVLDRCRRAGTGRFQTSAGRGDRWRPWSRDEANRIERAWGNLGKLRDKLVAIVEDPEGAYYQGRPVAEAELDEGHLATLAWVKRAMEQFVAWDGVPDAAGSDDPSLRVAGIGGLPAVRVFGHDLHRQLGHLAQDWLGSHTTTSSDYIQFLLQAGQWTPHDAVEALVRRHVNQEPFFEHTPDAKVEAIAEKFPEPRLEDDPQRSDLRAIPCYTIDPPDAKDFDDAVGIEAGADGWRLWVHVADVSHYVSLDSTLDRHARNRATSVYLPGRVLPMLPSRLSDHLCSLRDDGDRFALSVALDVDPAGRITAKQFHVALIRVTENLSYGRALERANRGEEPFATLLRVAGLMRSHRTGLELDTGERKVLVRDEGFSALEKRGDAMTRMIETFMVAANEAVAEHLAAQAQPLLYRCHPLPDVAKAERFSHQLDTMGFAVPLTFPRASSRAAQPETLLDRLKSSKGGKLSLFGGGIDLADDDAPPAPAAPEPLPGFAGLKPDEREAWLAPMRRAVEALAAHGDKELADVATLKLLACMGRAYYTPKNEGHYGLGSTHYCHFTSPIRRYPDLVVHRNLKWLLRGKAGDIPHSEASLAAMCDHCSNQERAAAELERRVKSACMVLATLGTTTEDLARITGITPASVFVARDDGIEARIAQRDLPGGPFDVDEWESMLLERGDTPGADAIGHALHGPRTRAKLGDVVRVRLAGRDVAAGRTGALITSW